MFAEIHVFVGESWPVRKIGASKPGVENHGHTLDLSMFTIFWEPARVTAFGTALHSAQTVIAKRTLHRIEKS